MPRIIFNVVNECYRPYQDELSSEQRNVLTALEQYKSPKVEKFFEHYIVRFKTKDIFIDKPIILKPDFGPAFHATFVKFRNNSYIYVNMKYSDFLRKIGKAKRKESEKKSEKKAKIIKEYEVHKFE